MIELNYVAIAVGAFAAFVVSTVYYMAFAKQMAGLHLDITDWTGAVRLGLAMWVGFPVVLLTGSVIWEKVPGKLAAIHAGDWLLKLLILSVIVSVWR